jgi:O-phosphoseryl-tRNA(Cys) synthetase
MENTEKMVARGTAWLEAQTEQQTAKDRTIRFVKEMVADLTDGEDLSDAEISLFKTAIKGTRVRITLSTEEEQTAEQHAEDLFNILNTYGKHLSIPRDRSTEKVQEAVLDAALSLKRENAKKGDA